MYMYIAMEPTEMTSNPTKSPTYDSSEVDFSIIVSVEDGKINTTLVGDIVNENLRVYRK